MKADRKLWTRTTTAAACMAVAVTVGTTGCSGEGKGQADPFAGLSAEAIADKAEETARTVTAVRMTGHQEGDGTKVAMDVRVDGKGLCEAELTNGDGGRGTFLRVDRSVYTKGDDAFWDTSEENRTVGRLLAGRWAKSSYEEGGSLSGFCDLRNVFEGGDGTTGLTRGEDTEVGGVPAVTLTGKAEGGGTRTLHIAKDADKPYFLRVVDTGGKETGEITFGDFGRPVAVTAPPADRTVDMDEVLKALD
ncbi:MULTISPECIES: hypothetical protein [unclassified Streptomyces]|uniref:hypothetical protein n=1 Tax=unclassified Streptomyces TaxID=2593676 RepID=UPI0006AE3EE4|nr:MULTISPECIES: hypothetical protein [unclassified Streptomyces]KOX34948.1 hypothetical protein ADL06_07155 [Streptomyces sp. NRRL F-6491]KOX50867.1 hypothetical protein ADL08_05655 [Streptomyces sp. NRRL F-6492]